MTIYAFFILFLLVKIPFLNLRIRSYNRNKENKVIIKENIAYFVLNVYSTDYIQYYILVLD